MGARRAIVVVLDSVGCGYTPDAGAYGDAGADTLSHTAAAVGGLVAPILGALGLGYTTEIGGVVPKRASNARWARLRPISAGKDTTTGHWELMGLPTESALPTYPGGFPESVISAFTAATGYGVLANRPASGTEIINELGEEHLRTGDLIVYTSADSVFQIAAHVDRVPIEELYRVCETAREHVLVGDHAVGRVIARPFGGSADTGFTRVAGRHDYALAPSGPTLLSELSRRGIPVVGVGKIGDIFAGVGVDASIPTATNAEGLDVLSQLISRLPIAALDGTVFDRGLAFANLVDFDSVWGHRRDPQAYAAGLSVADAEIGRIAAALGPDDILIVTADHGCDPTWPGTDHTREAVPAIVVGPALDGASLGTLASLGAVGATVAEWLMSADAAPDTPLEFRAPSLLTPRTYPLPGVVSEVLGECRPHVEPTDELYLVGGVLRDAVRAAYDHVALPDTPDIDLAINGSVGAFIACAEADGFSILSRNEALETARLKSPTGVEFDLAATRAERYADRSAYPSLERGVPIEWDLARRDFTVNAMALPATVGARGTFTMDDLIDPYYGERDVAQRTLRILHPDSFSDDPTRIIRLLRFGRRLGFTPDGETAHAAAAAIASGEFVKVGERQMEREVGLLYDELGA